MLDETSPYIAGWFAVTVLTLMLLKYVYLGQGLDEQGEAEVRMIKSTVSSFSNPILINLDTTISIILDIMLNNEHPNGPNSFIQAVYQSVLSLVKPSITLATGVFCCAIHAYVYDLRFDNHGDDDPDNHDDDNPDNHDDGDNPDNHDDDNSDKWSRPGRRAGLCLAV